MSELEISEEMMLVLFDTAEERGCKGKCPGALGVAKEFLKGKSKIDSELAAKMIIHCSEEVLPRKLKSLLFPEPVYFNYDTLRYPYSMSHLYNPPTSFQIHSLPPQPFTMPLERLSNISDETILHSAGIFRDLLGIEGNNAEQIKDLIERHLDRVTEAAEHLKKGKKGK